MSADSSPTVAVTVKQRRIPRWLLRPAVSDVTGRRRRHLRSVAVHRLTVYHVVVCLRMLSFLSVQQSGFRRPSICLTQLLGTVSAVATSSERVIASFLT